MLTFLKTGLHGNKTQVFARKHFQNPSTVFIPTSVLLQDATFARAASRDRQGRPFTRDIINITHAHRSYCVWERGAKMDPPK